MKKNRIDIISLGCSKNLVDSERIYKRLELKGYEVYHDSELPQGEYVVVNTCGFISDAKEESINMILELIRLKNEGEIGQITVMGCLSERYMNDLKVELPEVDNWYGKFDWKNFIESLPEIIQAKKPKDWERHITTPSHSAFLKISEGCNRFCAFCAIPRITGRHTSRPLEEILEETKSLVKQGVKEFNIIAQDLSSYGTDLYGKQSLAELIDKISDISGVEWIRLHYAYPSDFPMDVIDVMKRKKNVCNYLDIALQHISTPVLKNMQRHITREETLNLLKAIKNEIPYIHIRTTLMVGFPGEGEEEFKELVDFVKSQRFERMGSFAYSEEDDTFAAAHFNDSIPQEIKRQRLDKLMSIQEEISLQLNTEKIGKVFRVLIDRVENGNGYGRTEYDSPEVDPEVIIYNCTKKPGEFINVKIKEALPFELIAEEI